MLQSCHSWIKLNELPAAAFRVGVSFLSTNADLFSSFFGHKNGGGGRGPGEGLGAGGVVAAVRFVTTLGFSSLALWMFKEWWDSCQIVIPNFLLRHRELFRDGTSLK